MTLLAELNAMPENQAASNFRDCCGSRAWVAGMLARRPFASRDALFTAGDDVWSGLSASDWREAFAAHPRIGEQGRGWSAGEQSVAARAADSAKRELASVQRDYEAKFGHIFIICASGREHESILAAARERLHNDPGTELRLAAEEQRKITRLRLAKLIPDHAETTP